MELVRYVGAVDWSALYVDGALDIVGDHYLIDERISQLFKVDERHSNDFLRGGNNAADVPHSLEEVEVWTAEQEKASTQTEADTLRALAAELLRKADSLS